MPNIPNCPVDPFGGSLYFNGTSYAEFQSGSFWAVGRKDFTIEWYMKQTGSDATQSIFYMGGAGDSLGHLGVRLFGNVMRVYMNNKFAVGGVFTNLLNNWTHVAISHHDDKLYLYQDGVLVNRTVINDSTAVTDISHPFRIGGSPTFSSYLYFHGYITNFHFVNGVGIYDGESHATGDRVFYKPYPPVNTVNESVFLLQCQYSCSPLYNSVTSTNIDGTNYGATLSSQFPDFKKIEIPNLYYDNAEYSFGLGAERVEPYDAGFTPNEVVKLSTTQNNYSFDHYQIYSPITVVTSNLSYVTIYGYTASFDPNTEVKLSTSENITGSSALIRASYR